MKSGSAIVVGHERGDDCDRLRDIPEQHSQIALYIVGDGVQTPCYYMSAV